MTEYDRIVAAYDKDPTCHNYDFSVARARIAELEAALAERDELLAMLESGGVRIVSDGGSFTLAEFSQGLTDLRAREVADE